VSGHHNPQNALLGDVQIIISASDNGRPASRIYDRSKIRDVSDATGGRHSGEDEGEQGSGEGRGGEDEE